MPELPEVEVIKRGLNQTIVGKKIKNVEVRLLKVVSVGPKTISNIRKNNKAQAQKFARILRGRKIDGIQRRAKLVIINLTPALYKMLIHLKLTGQLIYTGKPRPRALERGKPHKHTHVIFNFADGSRLFFNDIRQFGYIRLVRDDEVSQIKELQSYGPEPLTKQFSLDYLKKKAKTRQRLSVKQFLMEPEVVAGIGNIYSDEILYCAKVKPTRKVSQIKDSEWKLLYKCVPRILKEAIKYQGSSVGDFLKADGSEGRYGPRHKVYQRAGYKCKKCGSVIKSVKLGGRTGSFCPKCQR